MQNLLKREFSADYPNQIWVSDITYFKVKSYQTYLCIILDLYSRKIVAWRVSRHMSTNLVTATFKAAFGERGKPENLTFHSDRGKQYTSETFVDLLQGCGVKQSFSATAKPLDNAVAETFFSTFKREEAYRREYTSEQHFRRSVEEYVRFYNEIRPHKTPICKGSQAFKKDYRAPFFDKNVRKAGLVHLHFPQALFYWVCSFEFSLARSCLLYYYFHWTICAMIRRRRPQHESVPMAEKCRCGCPTAYGVHP